jgi:hypothetical protein
MTLDQYKRHLGTCEYNTTKSVVCKNGCGIPISLPLIQVFNFNFITFNQIWDELKLKKK